VLATKEVRNSVLFSHPAVNDASSQSPLPSSLRVLFWQVLCYFTDTYAEVFALTQGPPLHDPLAVAAILEPAIFGTAGHGESEFFKISIVTEGAHDIDVSKVGELGRTKVELLPAGTKGVRIPRSVDVANFWLMIEDCLKIADGKTPLPELTREELEKHGVEV
jgi:uridine nucleosidase